MPKTSSKKEYRKKLRRLTIDFYPTETKLWSHIENQPQKQTYIKDLIRSDLEGQSSTRICPTCKSTWHHKEAICPNCGTNLTED